MRRIGLAVVLVLSACWSSGPCDEPSGTYLVHYRYRSGNCGDLPEVVFRAEDAAQNREASGCKGGNSWSADRCDVEFSSSCSSDAGTLTITGKVSWSHDASRADGTVQMSGQTPGASCGGTYGVTYSRL